MSSKLYVCRYKTHLRKLKKLSESLIFQSCSCCKIILPCNMSTETFLFHLMLKWKFWCWMLWLGCLLWCLRLTFLLWKHIPYIPKSFSDCSSLHCLYEVKNKLNTLIQPMRSDLQGKSRTMAKCLICRGICWICFSNNLICIIFHGSDMTQDKYLGHLEC